MKLEDISYVYRDIQNEMPIHTLETAKIPQPFSHGLPKNAMELSDKVQNKFLNNHLAEIEDADHFKLLTKHFKDWFFKQNREYHLKSGILNHDGFFQLDPYGYMMPKNTKYGHHGNAFISFAVSGVPGADLETFSTPDFFSNAAANEINIERTPATDGVVTELYDQIAIDSDNATGNIHLGAYDDDGSEPDNLYFDTGSVAMAADYAFHSVTEFALATSKTWVALVKSSASNLNQKTDGTFERRAKSFTFGALPDPAGTGYGTGTTIHRLKIGHS